MTAAPPPAATWREQAAELYQRHGALLWELVRFGTIGGTSVLIYAIAMLVLVQAAGVDIAVATVPAYLLSMVFNYLMQKLWTFRSKASHISSVPKYLFVHAVGIAINYFAVAGAIHVLGAHYALGQAAAIAIIATWSYVGQKFWAFAQKNGR
jgi:putative flippase GtrA